MTADLAVFSAHGLAGCAAITALTVQSNLGVRRVEATAAAVLAETLQCLQEDLPPAGIKIGMLGREESVAAVADLLRRLRMRVPRIPVVLDPVLRSSSGAELLSRAGVKALREQLLGLVDWVTPNRAELSCLTGARVASAEETERESAGMVREFPGLNVIATGGDEERADDLVMLRTGEARWLRGETIASDATHGTGCAFSSALLCGLVRGLGPAAAAEAAKGYVAEAIRRAAPVDAGKGNLALLWPLTGP